MKKVAVLCFVSFLMGAAVYAAFFSSEEKYQRLSKEARHALAEEKIAHLETRERLQYESARVATLGTDLNDLEEEQRRIEIELQQKVRVIARLEARLARKPVEVIVPGPAPEPIVVECEDGGTVECPPCPPPKVLDIGGGVNMQLIHVDGKRAATADWWCDVAAPEFGWGARRGPERVEDLLFFAGDPAPGLPANVHWAAGIGLWSPSESLFSPSVVATVRRSRFSEGRKWGWWTAIDLTVDPGSVDSLSQVDLGGWGVRAGIERR